MGLADSATCPVCLGSLEASVTCSEKVVRRRGAGQLNSVGSSMGFMLVPNPQPNLNPSNKTSRRCKGGWYGGESPVCPNECTDLSC